MFPIPTGDQVTRFTTEFLAFANFLPHLKGKQQSEFKGAGFIFTIKKLLNALDTFFVRDIL